MPIYIHCSLNMLFVNDIKIADFLINKAYEGRSICNENSPVSPKVLYLHNS